MHRSLGSVHEVLTDYARKLIRRKARQLAHRIDFVRSDEDDIAQEITMHLLSQASRFDPSRAAPSTFASVVIESGIRMLLRKRNRKQSRPPEGVEIQSLDATVEQPGQPAAPLESLISVEDGERLTRRYLPSDVEEFEDQEAFELAFRKLPEHLQRLCNELISVPPALAARNLGISRNQMSTAMETLRAHFTSAGLGRE